ncbi:hypothetical protein HN827_07395 [archaeon]|jgi:hypothetical protein|nr:hypothetical protein [archaeon]MBT7392630.1 hypothetical protein [archaeon]
MRYNQNSWVSEVNYYKRKLKKLNPKNIFIYGKISKKAFFSLAPLSCATNELGIEMCVKLDSSSNQEYLFDFWDVFDKYKKKVKNKKTVALSNFIDQLDKKSNKIKKYFKRPDLILKIKKESFGNILEYKTSWIKYFMWNKLKKTADSIIKNVYNLKKKDNFGIGFEFVLKKKNLDVPLQDYLDSYFICYSKYLSAIKITNKISMSASTRKMSSLDMPNLTTELITTLIGLELSKNIDEPIFKKYNILSKELNLNRIKINSATFAISGKGYPGKHLFGQMIGYPTPNKKTRWSSPSGIIYKFSWYPQSHEESRDPMNRISFTQTVPIDIYIKSTLIDYNLMRKRNKKISNLLEKCDTVFVKSNIKNGCNFEVGLIKKDGTRRMIKGSDSDTRKIINPNHKDKNFGMMANIPGGEAFTTPEYIKGKIVGDVVIEIDRSYPLSSKKPFIVECNMKGYKVISGPKKVIDAFNRKKKEAWIRIKNQEKSKSIPSKLIKLKKDNFNKIGEFAINTNPNAKLCDYLIINEKIANMIHVAFGSGFEPDKATEYHMDVVIDSPRQKLDIFGIDKNKKEIWIIKKGKFVI